MCLALSKRSIELVLRHLSTRCSCEVAVGSFFLTGIPVHGPFQRGISLPFKAKESIFEGLKGKSEKDGGGQGFWGFWGFLGVLGIWGGGAVLGMRGGGGVVGESRNWVCGGVGGKRDLCTKGEGISLEGGNRRILGVEKGVKKGVFFWQNRGALFFSVHKFFFWVLSPPPRPFFYVNSMLSEHHLVEYPAGLNNRGRSGWRYLSSIRMGPLGVLPEGTFLAFLAFI